MSLPDECYFLSFLPCQERASLKAQLSPWNVPSWISRNRSHLAAFSGQGSHFLPRSLPWLSQAPNPIGPVSSGCPIEETSPQRLRPRKMTTASRLQRQGWGEVHRSSRPGPRLLEGLSEGSGALQDVVPSLFIGNSSSPTGPRLGDLQALQMNAWIWLFSLFPAGDHHTTHP